MKAQTYIFSIVIVLAISACRKDDIDPSKEDETCCLTDTNQVTTNFVCSTYVAPGDYFPAHPGSWWTYNVLNNPDLIYNVDTIPHNFYGECLPFVLNLPCCVKDNDFILLAYYGQGQTGIEKSIIVPSVLNEVHHCFASLTDQLANGTLGPSSPPYRRELITADTTITTLNGDTYNNVRVVQETHIYDSTHIYLEYFALDIGLVKRDSVNYQNTSVITEVFSLSDYFINN